MTTQRRGRLLVQWPIGLVLGVVLALAYPPYGWWPLAPLAVAASSLLVRPNHPGRAALLGLTTGLGFFLLLLRWMHVVGADAWIGLALLMALFFIPLFWALAMVRRLRWWPLWTACLWVAGEFTREFLPFSGFPWGRLAFAQAESPYRALASLGGMALVSFAVALTGSLIALAIASRGLLSRLVPAGVAVAIPVLALTIPLPTNGRTVDVALIQGNVPTSGLDAFGQRQAVLNNHLEATSELSARIAAGTSPRPAVVIWPENASDLDPFVDKAAAELIQTGVTGAGVPVLVGAVIRNPGDPKTVLNVGILWDPKTGPGPIYVKRHPVPFGEYLPLRSLVEHVITRFDRVPRDFAAGTQPGLFDVGGFRLGSVICFEVAYDKIVRDVVNGNAELLVVQTNNATYGHTGQPDQQFAITQLRAIESGRTVVVAATSGISGVIGADGRVVTRSGEFERWTYDGPVTLRTERTLATRLGALPERILGILGLVALLAATVRRRGEDQSQS